jgi:hypothetical protein
MLLPTIPLLLSVDEFLGLWLTDVPSYTTEFVIIMLVNGLLSSLSSGFDAAIQATGDIKNYQITVSIILLSSLIVSYFLFYLGSEPYIINIVFLIASCVSVWIGIRFMRKLTEFTIRHYFQKTISKVLSVLILLIPLYFIRMFFPDSILSVILFSIFSVSLILVVIYFVGLELSERHILRRYLFIIYHKVANFNSSNE